MAKKKEKSTDHYMYGKDWTVGLAEAGVKYPGSKTVKKAFRNYLKGVRAGGK